MGNVKRHPEIQFDHVALQLARLRRGLTQEQLAQKLDLSEGAIRSWENGRRLPSGTNLLRVAELLELSTEDLYFMSEDAA